MQRAKRMSRVVAGLAIGAAVTAGLSGCLISGRSSSSMTGEYVGSSTYSQIEEGVTTDEWLRAALGEPTSKSTLEDGTDLWKWGYRKTRKSRGAVFLIFGGSSDRVETGATYVELRDGVVVKKWRD